MSDFLCEVCENNKHIDFMKKGGFNFCRCSSCGIERIWPQPSNEQLEKIYGQHYYDAWGIETSPKTVETLKKATFEKRLSLIRNDLKAEAKLLDLGCATGYFLDVAQESGFEAFGVELSEYGANQTAAKHGKDHVFHGEFENSIFAANPINKFDAIFMSDFIEHVRDPKIILQLAHNRLNQGGKIVITTPMVKSFSYFIMGKTWSQYKTEHLFYFSFSNIKKLLEELNYSNVKYHKAIKCMTLDYIITQFMNYHHPLFTPIFKVTNKILPDVIKARKFWITLGDMVVIAEKI